MGRCSVWSRWGIKEHRLLLSDCAASPLLLQRKRKGALDIRTLFGAKFLSSPPVASNLEQKDKCGLNITEPLIWVEQFVSNRYTSKNRNVLNRFPQIAGCSEDAPTCWEQVQRVLFCCWWVDWTPVPAELSQWFCTTAYQLSRHRKPSPKLSLSPSLSTFSFYPGSSCKITLQQLWLHVRQCYTLRAAQQH